MRAGNACECLVVGAEGRDTFCRKDGDKVKECEDQNRYVEKPDPYKQLCDVGSSDKRQ